MDGEACVPLAQLFEHLENLFRILLLDLHSGAVCEMGSTICGPIIFYCFFSATLNVPSITLRCQLDPHQLWFMPSYGHPGITYKPPFPLET